MKQTDSGAFRIENVQTDYPKLIRLLLDKGEESSPRGNMTKELIDVVTILDPHYAIITGINRNLNLKLISMEALQLISCTSYVQRTLAAAPMMGMFMDGGSFHGAYGVRIGVQLEGVINRLRSDKHSRQAVITIWDPLRDAYRTTAPKDVPCTTMLQFLIRDDRLVMHVTMRSNDVWWGTPHDWGQFSQLQLAIARVLGIKAGDYYHHAVSFHLYSHDFDKIDQLTAPTKPLTYHDGIGARHLQENLESIQTTAKLLMNGENHEDKTFQVYTDDTLWHMKRQREINASIT